VTPDPNIHALRIRKLKHDIRGCMHGMSLCVAAMETPLTPEDAVDFLKDIESAAVRLDQLIEELAAALPDEP
jgi:hypothetical protein